MLLRSSAIVLVIVLAGRSATPQSAEIRREDTEWADVWMPHMAEKNLPRVLLVGDSITRAYFKEVEHLLEGKAYLAQIATSKAVGDPALISELETFVSEGRFDVIHFNFGMHGWGYTEDDYKRHFPDVFNALRKTAPKAKLIWASTTPVRKDLNLGPGGGPFDVGIRGRNAIALAFCEHQGVPVDDLYTLVAGRPELHSDDIHFNGDGTRLQAAQVAAWVTKLLPVGRP